MQLTELSKDEAFHAINTGEFSEKILTSAENVVIILTQNWCSQWLHMSGWLNGIAPQKNVKIYSLSYNETDYFDEFLRFKEEHFDNDLVPYLRFYRNGELVKETNYISQGRFNEILSV